jgi:hypothetical protein
MVNVIMVPMFAGAACFAQILPSPLLFFSWIDMLTEWAAR